MERKMLPGLLPGVLTDRLVLLATVLSLMGLLFFAANLMAAAMEEPSSGVPPATREGARPGEDPGEGGAEPAPPEGPDADTAVGETREPPPSKTAGYGGVDLSMVNFEARGIPGGETAAYGLMFVGGYRMGEYFSIEGALDFIPLADSYFLLPIPMMWMPSEDGIYLNLAGGMRFNLAEYSSHSVIPWVSLWYTGHALLGDFDVAGVGFTYGAGMEWKKKGGGRGRISLRIHTFDGKLEIDRKNSSTEYGRTDIRAVELSFTLFGN